MESKILCIASLVNFQNHFEGGVKNDFRGGGNFLTFEVSQNPISNYEAGWKLRIEMFAQEARSRDYRYAFYSPVFWKSKQKPSKTMA